MCGGRGTRLDREGEKPLAPVAGRSMVDRTLDALAASRVETAYAAVSPHTPRTRERLGERASGGGRVADGAERGAGSVEVTVVDTPGDGYVADLQAALAEGPEPPVLTVAVDLPLLDGPAVDTVLDAHAAAGSDSLSVRVPAARKRGLGASADAATRYDDGDEAAGEAVDPPDERVPAGVNVVGAIDGGGDEAVRATRDARLALNVNRPGDRRLAERILAGECDAPTLPTGGVEWLGEPGAAEGGDRS
ncbi:NTP transferase domain-containing protein [Halorubrum ezzemoulense]|uniref:NTP transferase domain-containing protein n=1 Tax=Halorubrum ezzemoulense TaxID=337243 RepID=UPI00232C9F0E|nr:NTP transferase domain-containing protein [Halorubrum ezzemoulense]MDB2223973.1 NTP transferase domain-containing protein [Halorubrum ezzemoulense]